MTTSIDAAAESPQWPRILSIANCHNLREMGGYRATDGRTLKWRHLYRSGAMSPCTETGRNELAALGIKVIFDLRGKDERQRQPTEWHLDLDIEYWSRDYNLSLGALKELRRRGIDSATAMLERVHEIYRVLPYEQAEAYRELFRRLAAGQVPLLFNCSAGKDRTGIAAALVLSALDIPRAIIADDYAMTDHALEQLVKLVLDDPKHSDLHAMRRELYEPLLRADPRYLDVAFNEMERRHGSVRGYLEEILGVGNREIEAIRGHLLESLPL